MELHYWYCRHCGKVIVIVDDTGTPTMCCGSAMVKLQPMKHDGMMEKHVPVVITHGRSVTVLVGTVQHPMNSEHYIKWILLQTDMGIHKVCLVPEDLPQAHFTLEENEKIIDAWTYCNVHKLWKTE